MKRGTPRHPKTKDLARRLKIPVPYAVGILEMLWEFTREFYPRGDVGRGSDEDIADAVGWPEADCRTLISALVESRWLNPTEEPDRLAVHDWHDHADDYTKKKIRDLGIAFASVQKIPENSGKFSPTLPNLTLPNQTRPDRRPREKFPAASEPLDEQFAEFRLLFEEVGNPIPEEFANGSFTHRAWSILDFFQRKVVVESLRERKAAGVQVLNRPDTYLTKGEYKRKIRQHRNGTGNSAEELAAL